MDLLSEYALCLGVCHSSLQKNVHLLKLDDPHMTLTRRWHPGEQFEVGKWYKKDQRLYSKLEDDIVKTIAVRTMDSNAMGQSTFELVLPAYFVPDFSDIDLGGKLPMLKDPNKADMPICPLFGPEGIEVLPPVKWSNGNGRDNIYSDTLYALRINISYISGDTPLWTPQSVGQLKPWNYEQYPIVSQLLRENRIEGIVIDQMMKHFGTSFMQYCLITNKQAQLSIGVFSESKAKIVGEYLQFWPMQLDFYEFPLVLALDCPQESNSQSIIRHSQFIQKCASNTFKFKIEKKDFEKLSQDNYHVSWLGRFIDAHHFVDDKQLQSIKDKNLLEIHSQPQWCLKKRSVCWIIIDDIKECNTSSSLPEMNLTRQQEAVTSDQLIQSDKLRAISPNSEGSSNKSAMGISSSLPSISSSPNASLVRKKALAAFMTIRLEGGDPVVLFWDVSTEKFNRKCYAEFHKNIAFPLIPADFGKWYELTYWDVPNNERRIIVLDYRNAERKAVTRIRDEICAQFSTNRDRYINVWHAKFPCEAKNNYYEDKGWWPWLCRACYPDLRDLSPPIVQELSTIPGTSKSVEIQNKEGILPSLEELATKMKSSLALEEENIEDYSDTESISSLPIKKLKQDVNQSQQLANFNKQKSASISQFPINSNTQTALAVLLIVRDNDDLVFLFYNEQEKKFKYRIYADPPTHDLTIGDWYTLSYKLNTAGLQNSQKIAIMSAKLISKGPVETRVYNRMIAQTRRKYTSVAPGYEDEFTDSDTESYVTGEVRDDLSIGDGWEDESPNITPTGTPKPNETASINCLVQCQFPDLTEKPFNGFSMTKLDTFNLLAESTELETNQQDGNALDANVPSTFQLNGGFGSARLRRLQLAKSTSSSKPPPCFGDRPK